MPPLQQQELDENWQLITTVSKWSTDMFQITFNNPKAS